MLIFTKNYSHTGIRKNMGYNHVPMTQFYTPLARKIVFTNCHQGKIALNIGKCT